MVKFWTEVQILSNLTLKKWNNLLHISAAVNPTIYFKN